MDQGLLDAARYKMTNLSMDSRFADKYYAGTADYQMRMPSMARNVIRIALTSIEIPNVEWVFSEAHGNLSFDWYFTTSPETVYIVTIPAGNYTASQLAAAIDTAMGAGFTVTVSPTTGLLEITHDTQDFTLSMASTVDRIAARRSYWGLGYYMGFREKIMTSSGFTLRATAPVNVQSAPYYLIQLETPSLVTPLQHRLMDNGWIGAFAKVILRGGVYTIDFDDGGNMLRKENTFLAPVSIQSIRVRIVDPFGEQVDLHDMDWSITLELYEVVNSRVYSAISETFQRT